VLGITDVIRAHPNWNLIVPPGWEAFIALKAEQDPDYSNFWARLQTRPEEMTYRSFQEGLSLIAKEDYVMLNDDIIIESFLMSNPFHVQRLKILSTGRKYQGCIKFELYSSLSRN
jgi:hypothetical protein